MSAVRWCGSWPKVDELAHHPNNVCYSNKTFRIVQIWQPYLDDRRLACLSGIDFAQNPVGATG